MKLKAFGLYIIVKRRPGHDPDSVINTYDVIDTGHLSGVIPDESAVAAFSPMWIGTEGVAALHSSNIAAVIKPEPTP